MENKKGKTSLNRAKAKWEIGRKKHSHEFQSLDWKTMREIEVCRNLTKIAFPRRSFKLKLRGSEAHDYGISFEYLVLLQINHTEMC